MSAQKHRFHEVTWQLTESSMGQDFDYQVKIEVVENIRGFGLRRHDRQEKRSESRKRGERQASRLRLDMPRTKNRRPTVLGENRYQMLSVVTLTDDLMAQVTGLLAENGRQYTLQPTIIRLAPFVEKGIFSFRASIFCIVWTIDASQTLGSLLEASNFLETGAY